MEQNVAKYIIHHICADYGEDSCIIRQNCTKYGEKDTAILSFELRLGFHHIFTDYGQVYLYNSPKLN